MTKVAPALLAGCTVVVKPAPETPLDAYLMAELLEEAGVPAGVVNIVAGGREVGEHLVAHPGIDKVAFTGSTAAGRKIAAVCGEQLKRVSLELGGKSAAIVLDDADLAATMEGLKFTALMNNGQACVAQTRILASRAQLRQRRRRARRRPSARMQVGDPMRPGDRDRPARRAAPAGAGREVHRARPGGGRPGRARRPAARRALDRGWYVRPTIFADVDNGMRIAQEEIFGPVLSVIPYDDDDDAVRIANDSDYGLAGTVWTGDVEAGLDVARRVRAGTYGVNTYTMDFAAPFGGFKASGIGREFGPEGLGAVHRAQVDLHQRRDGVTEQLNELAYYAVTHHPADARKVFSEATDAEALGLGSCMISERFTVKEAGVLAGAVAGRAPSLGIGSAAINHHTRHPIVTAAMGSTLKALTEGRYAMSFGRAPSEHWKHLGLPVVTEAVLRDFITTLRQLWTDGYVLDHDGRPASGRCSTTCTGWRAAVRRSGSSPSDRRRWRSPGSSATSSSCTPSSASRRRQLDRGGSRGAELAGRDPDAVRIWSCLAAVPDGLSEEDRLRRGVGRLVTYFQAYGDTLVSVNGGTRVLGEAQDVRALHEASSAGGAIDATASTETLLRLGEMVPDEWLDASAHGRSEDAARTIVRELELGCHSVILHGAEPQRDRPDGRGVPRRAAPARRPVATNPGLFA